MGSALADCADCGRLRDNAEGWMTWWRSGDGLACTCPDCTESKRERISTNGSLVRSFDVSNLQVDDVVERCCGLCSQIHSYRVFYVDRHDGRRIGETKCPKYQEGSYTQHLDRDYPPTVFAEPTDTPHIIKDASELATDQTYKTLPRANEGSWDDVCAGCGYLPQHCEC
jgi:hypothetical protein